jgi:hypothetical protein
LLFSTEYAEKRNAVLHIAIKNKIDYLLFPDDDEYPNGSYQNAHRCNMERPAPSENPKDYFYCYLSNVTLAMD